MAFIDDIDYEMTLSKHRLVLKTRGLDIADSFVFFLAGCLFLVYIVLTFKEANLSNPNDKAIAYGLLPFAGLFAIIMLYKKATEKRLLTITTGLNKSDTRELIKKTFKAWGWKIRTDRANYLQATTGFEFRWGKQVTVLFDNEKLYLNVMSDNPMVRMPVLFSDRLFRYDIKKMLEASTQQQLGKSRAEEHKTN